MRKLLCAIGLVAALGTTANGSATTLNFDSLTTAYAPVPTPYNGFNFSNFSVNTLGSEAPSGYINGTVSGSSVIYNYFGLGAAMSASGGASFTLNDFYLTAAINDGLEVDVIGSLGGVTLYSTVFYVSTMTPTRELLDWTGINTVSFTSSGGTLDPVAGLSYVPGTQFVLDNVRVNEALTPVTASAPEPGSLGLLGTGLVALAALRRKFVSRT